MKQPKNLISPLRPFRYPHFRNLWIATFIAFLGFWMYRVSASWLMMEMTHSPSMVATMEALFFLPSLFFSVIAGIIADYVNRARYLVIVISYIIVIQLLLWFLIQYQFITPWTLLMLVLALGMGSAFRNPALEAEMSRSVPQTLVKSAVALGSINFNASRILGPALGGLIIGAFAISTSFLISAISCLGLLLVFATWNLPCDLLNNEGVVFEMLSKQH